MSSIFDRLCSDCLIQDYPAHMKNNVHYEVMMGSTAYGVSTDDSDVDIYGFSMPPKHILFPYAHGKLYGFGSKPENFEQFQKHHIKDKSRGKEYDISIYSIIKFFQLTMENNPNMVDALFVPTRCVLHSTQVGEMVREKRHYFLSKRSWHKFKGYAFSQLHKMKNKHAKEFVDICRSHGWDTNISLENIAADKNFTGDLNQMKKLIGYLETNGKRSKRLPKIMEYGYDTKFAYHVIRLMDEVEQILETGDLDLTRSREQMKAVRRGEWSMDRVIEYADTKLISLEGLYGTSTLPHSADEEVIKELLLNCIEHHYGSLENVIKGDDKIIQHLIDAHGSIAKALRYV